MNETIALPRLAELLAAKADIDLHDAENFIRQFFAQIENVLAVTEEVNIKGLGCFSIHAADGVRFTPDNDFAEYLNQPFDMFSPIEIDDEADIADTSTKENASAIIAQQEDATQPEPVHEVHPEPDETPAVAENRLLDNHTNNATDKTTGTTTIIYEEKPEQRNHRHIIGYIITAIVCIALGYLLHYFIDTQSAPSAPAAETTDSIVPADSIDIVPEIEPDTIAAPAETIKEIVTDTVTPTRFLTTMARQYYGQMEYWVFIYLANEDVLGNPNRTRPGTVVVIPQESDFTDGETREQTIVRAKRLGREIYARYE